LKKKLSNLYIIFSTQQGAQTIIKSWNDYRVITTEELRSQLAEKEQTKASKIFSKTKINNQIKEFAAASEDSSTSGR
jgi:hypothetical protein